MRIVVAIMVLAVFPAPASALTVGIGEQHPDAFADARLQALHLPVARMIAPWDAATSEPATVRAWLAAVSADGMTPEIAFQHLNGDACPSRPCTLPSRAQYGAAVRAFLAAFPQVRTFTAWNEANHVSQPTATHPEAAAGYYDELRAACPSCTIVAGDVLDSGTFVQWLQRFQAATRSSPQLWGLHNYGDVTYGRTSGTDAVLAAVPGKLWIEETGGLVTRRNADGTIAFSASEADAAASVTRAFAIAATRPRITRTYIYHWRADATSTFDSGLVRPDGTVRPSYAAVVSALAKQTWSAHWSGSRLVLRAACVNTCTGRVTLSLRSGTRQLAHATRAFTSAKSLRVRVSRAVRTKLRRAKTRRLVLTVSSTRTTLRLARP